MAEVHPVIAFVSVWSAASGGLDAAIEAVDRHVDGYHVDVMDGRMVDRRLFGPSTIARLRSRTTRPIEAHLMVAEAERWIDDCAKAGADVITVHARSCRGLRAAIDAIAGTGAGPGLAIGTEEPIELARPHLDRLAHLLVMGTALGVKGAGLDARAYRRVREAANLCRGATQRPMVIADGGIRTTTAPRLAAAGADGVVPGSLVFSHPDPAARVRWLHDLRPG
jgi:ribulose-phosphate 3-epimerase